MVLLLSSCEGSAYSVVKTSSQNNNSFLGSTATTKSAPETVENKKQDLITQESKENVIINTASAPPSIHKATFEKSIDTAKLINSEPPIKKDFVDEDKKAIVEKNLWNYVSSRYSFTNYKHSRIDEQVKWFKKHSAYLTRVSVRAKPYLYLIVKEVEESNIPIEIALLPIIESAFYPFSYSHGTASGLWQFIPSTAKLYGLEDNWWKDDRRDVVASTKAAISYLSNLNKIFKGDWLLSIAAYNSGPGRVQREIKKNKKLGKKTDFWSLHLPPETRSYVPKLLAVARIIKNPKKYNQELGYIENKKHVQSVILDSQFDLALIAKWTDLSLDEIYYLNPGLKRWATPGEENYSILLPVGKVSQFISNASNHPNKEKVSWLRYKIKAGDTLSELALKYRTTIQQIQDINDLPSINIRAGKYIIVPVAQKEPRFYSLSEEQRKIRRMESHKNFKKIIHKVTKGDSLWEISRRYNVLIDSIVKWNQLSLTKPLRVGNELLIYKDTKTKYKDLSANQVGIDIDKKLVYSVRQDDNLSFIANKFDVTIEDIKIWNNIDIERPLQPGQKLTIVVNVINSQMK